MTELALVLAASRESGLADFERLMRLYERLVLTTALRLLGNLPDAQDAAQETFLRLYRNLSRIEDPDNCSAWLYRVTVNVCRDQLRRQAPTVAVEEAMELAASGLDPQQAAASTERREAMERALRRLTAKEREALVLKDLEGLSTAEVAATVGSTEATVRSHVARARIKLREAVARMSGRPG